MTRLNEAQVALVDKVIAVKALVDADLAALKEEYEAKVDLAKAPLREAARSAHLARVPARQLGTILGTSDHKTIKSYTGG